METHRLVSLSMTLMGFLSPCLTWLAPRVTFPLGSPGRPMVHFSSPGVSNTTTLLLSEQEDVLYVGARDAVLALYVGHKDAMILQNKIDWRPSEKDIEQCSMKGKKMVDCPNFIRVLQPLNTTHIYTCGTFAFSPRCTYINSKTFSMSNKMDEGRGRCPYDPYQRNTALVIDGELYTGTVADYRGNRPVISRHLSQGSKVDLKLEDTLGWLEDPTFISSSYIQDEGKLYIFFSEVGREYDFIDKFTVSRISQICTSDVGGQRTLQRRWTTFAKAQLLCQADGELPYNVIQDMDTLPPLHGTSAEDTLFYGIFTSQWSVNSGRSAVCAFRLSDIKSVFSGNYKILNRDTLQWSTRVQEKVANPGECGLHNATDNALRFVKENFLADDSVRPVGRSLTLVSATHSYSHLLAQRVLAANSKYYTVLYLLTESGYLHKVVLVQSGPFIIEEVQVFQRPQPVLSMQLSEAKGVIFVGTSQGVVRLPTANCSFYWTCAQCVLSRDPFCGWDAGSRTCVEISSGKANLLQDVERGNVDESCSSVPFSPQGRFSQSNLPAGELVLVSLNAMVRLQCPKASQLSQQSWERPNSRLSSDLFLHLADGSLSFVATPTTLGHYLCLSVENGYQQTMAIYQVKQKSSLLPHFQTRGSASAPTSAPTSAASQRTEATGGVSGTTLSSRSTHASVNVNVRGESNASWWWDVSPQDFRERELLQSGRSPCYLKELVAVSVLLVFCLSLLITILLYVVRQRCRSRTTPQVPGSPESSRPSPGQQERMNGNWVLCNGQGVSNGKPSGFQQAHAGSNGHLPNTPI